HLTVRSLSPPRRSRRRLASLGESPTLSCARAAAWLTAGPENPGSGDGRAGLHNRLYPGTGACAPSGTRSAPRTFGYWTDTAAGSVTLRSGGAATRNTSIARNATGKPTTNHNPRHRKVKSHCRRIAHHPIAGTYRKTPQCAATGTRRARAATNGESAISAKNSARIFPVFRGGETVTDDMRVDLPLLGCGLGRKRNWRLPATSSSSTRACPPSDRARPASSW